MRSKIQIQLLAVYILVLLVILIGFMTYITRHIFRPMQADVINNTEFLLNGLANQADTYFENLDQIMMNMIYKGKLQEYVGELNTRQEMDGMTILSYDRKFDDLIESLSTFPTVPSSHIIIYNKDLSYQYQYNRIEHTNIQQVLENKNFLERLNKDTKIICRQDNWQDKNRNKTFSIIRKISNLSHDELGYMELQLNYQYLDRICDFDDEKQVYLITPDGQMLYPARNEEFGELDFLDLLSGKETGTLQIQSEIYTWEKIPSYDLLIVMKQDDNVLFSSLNELKKTTLLILFLLFFASMPVLYYFQNKTLQPIKDLTGQIRTITLKKMEIDMERNVFSDEVKVLQDSFSQMLQRIRIASEHEIFFQKEQERMKYEALQKQIAPHFIHNTLYVISIAAQEHRTDDVTAMCKSLSDIMRYSMHTERMTVTFAEELHYIQDYLKLQAENYGQDFQYILNVSFDCEQITVPRMFLQPFVENCFKHGFGNCEPPYFLKITGYKLNGAAHFLIEDNGTGIDDAVIQRIKEQLEQDDFHPDKEQDSLGIVNTVLRLKYLYADKVCVSLRRGTKNGTIAEIIIEES